MIGGRPGGSRAWSGAAALAGCAALVASTAPAQASSLSRTQGRAVAAQLATGATTAQIVTWTAVRSRPGAAGRVFAHVGPLTSWSHEPQTLLVIGTAERNGHTWDRVLLGIRPDGSSGWIRRDNVVLRTTAWWVDVDKTRRTVSVRYNGRLVRRFHAVIGKAATPTPDGIAAVYERNRQPSPNDFLGTWALPLTIFSNVLMNFGGGPGRVAIHGRGGLSLLDPLGSAASHGCIRISNRAINFLAHHLGPGTPVDITG